MMREEVLRFINAVLEAEHAKPIGYGDTLPMSGLDSFGYIVLWMAIEERYGHIFSVEAISEMDYATMTLNTLIERIVDAKSHQS